MGRTEWVVKVVDLIKKKRKNYAHIQRFSMLHALPGNHDIWKYVLKWGYVENTRY